MFRTTNWLKLLVEVCGGWWSAMSGAASIPLALVALVFGGSSSLWFAVLAFVGLWVFAARVCWKNYKIVAIQKPQRDRALLTKMVDLIKTEHKIKEHPSIEAAYRHMLQPADSIGVLIKFIDEIQTEKDLEWFCGKLEEGGYQSPLKNFKPILDAEINGKWLPVLAEARIASQEIKTQAQFLSFLALNWSGKEKWKRGQTRIQENKQRDAIQV